MLVLMLWCLDVFDVLMFLILNLLLPPQDSGEDFWVFSLCTLRSRSYSGFVFLVFFYLYLMPGVIVLSSSLPLFAFLFFLLCVTSALNLYSFIFLRSSFLLVVYLWIFIFSLCLWSSLFILASAWVCFFCFYSFLWVFFFSLLFLLAAFCAFLLMLWCSSFMLEGL